MAIDLVNDNSTRHYTVPTSSSMDFPDSDWFFAFWTRLDDNSGSSFQYLVSIGPFQVANSMNLFLGEVSSAIPNTWRLSADTTVASATSTPGGDGKDRLIVCQRNGSNTEIWYCEPMQTATNEVTTAWLDVGVSGRTTYLGSREDTSSIRFYEEHYGDFIKGSVALTQGQIGLLARGVDPVTVAGFPNLDAWFQFREQTSQVIDVISGNVATRQGTGLATSEHFPVLGGLYSFVPETVAPGGADASLLLTQQSFRQ